MSALPRFGAGYAPRNGLAGCPCPVSPAPQFGRLPRFIGQSARGFGALGATQAIISETVTPTSYCYYGDDIVNVTLRSSPVTNLIQSGGALELQIKQANAGQDAFYALQIGSSVFYTSNASYLYSAGYAIWSWSGIGSPLVAGQAQSVLMTELVACPTPAAVCTPAPVSVATSTGTASISVSATSAGATNLNSTYLTAADIQVSMDDLTTVAQTIQSTGGVCCCSDSATAAVNGINTVSPGYPTMATVPTPAGASCAEMTSTSSNLAGWKPLSRAMAQAMPRASFGALGACTVGVAKSVLSDASAGAAAGSFAFGPVGSFIGGLIGGVVGLIEGLFGHKQSVPLITQADITQAKNWYAAYDAISSSTVGRTLSANAIHDMITAEAILNPGFWGLSTSSQINVEEVSNFYGEVMTRVNDFLNAIAHAAVGATISIHDDASIPGHGCGCYHPGVTYTFISPGINAPSYVLGPLFAQYFYTMCMIFRVAQDCTGHLNPPMPQFYTDLIDYVRAGVAGWDTPQPNVVGIVTSVPAPQECTTSCGRTTGGVETSAVAPVCIPSCDVAEAEATPGTGTAPVIVEPCTVAVCACSITPVCVPAGCTSASACEGLCVPGGYEACCGKVVACAAGVRCTLKNCGNTVVSATGSTSTNLLTESVLGLPLWVWLLGGGLAVLASESSS
jgi:hypothetical protein